MYSADICECDCLKCKVIELVVIKTGSDDDGAAKNVGWGSTFQTA